MVKALEVVKVGSNYNHIGWVIAQSILWMNIVAAYLVCMLTNSGIKATVSYLAKMNIISINSMQHFSYVSLFLRLY